MLENTIKIDTRQYIDTPEGIAIRLSVAGPVTRFLAWWIDIAIRVFVYLILSTVFSVLGDFGTGLTMITVFLLWWLYPVLFEVYYEGASPGKKAMGLAVVHDDGTPVGWSASMVRNILRTVDMLPFSYGFGLTSMLLTRDFKRMGDIVAGTLVIYTHPSKPASMPTFAEVISPAYSLDASEQQAVLSFSERSQHISEERADELAILTGPLVNDASEPGKHLLGIANWIAGKRP